MEFFINSQISLRYVSFNWDGILWYSRINSQLTTLRIILFTKIGFGALLIPPMFCWNWMLCWRAYYYCLRISHYLHWKYKTFNCHILSRSSQNLCENDMPPTAMYKEKVRLMPWNVYSTFAHTLALFNWWRDFQYIRLRQCLFFIIINIFLKFN